VESYGRLKMEVSMIKWRERNAIALKFHGSMEEGEGCGKGRANGKGRKGERANEEGRTEEGY